jgi:hypothetical protein
VTLKIEKNILIPPRRRVTPAGVEDFDKLEVGDSFAVPVPKEFRHKPTIWAGAARLRNAAYNYQKRTGRKLTVRCMADGVIRVWRVE